MHVGSITANIAICVAELMLTLLISCLKDPDRPLLSSSLAKADIFLLAFSVISPKSLENIKTKWILEVEHFTPKTHCVLLGLKHDWRGVENRERDEIEISVETALQVARDIGIISDQLQFLLTCRMQCQLDHVHRLLKFLKLLIIYGFEINFPGQNPIQGVVHA